MNFLTYHVKPTLKSGRDEIGGAYVNCFIVSESTEQAEIVARQQIEAQNWEILELDESTSLDAKSVNEKNREYYEQALIDKEVFVFYTYPIQDLEDD